MDINVDITQNLIQTDTSVACKSPEQASAVKDVLKERDYQDGLWGQANDRDSMTQSLWIKILTDYATGTCDRARGYDFRTRMIKASAIALAAVEAYDGKQSRI